MMAEPRKYIIRKAADKVLPVREPMLILHAHEATNIVDENYVLGRIYRMLKRLKVSQKRFPKQTLQEAARRYFKEITSFSERMKSTVTTESAWLDLPERAERLLEWMMPLGVRREDLAVSLLRSSRLLMRNPDSLYEKFMVHAQRLATYNITPIQLIQAFLVKPEVMGRSASELEEKIAFTLAITGSPRFALMPEQRPTFEERKAYILNQRPISLEFGKANYMLRLAAGEVLAEKRPSKTLLTDSREKIERILVDRLGHPMNTKTIVNPFTEDELGKPEAFKKLFDAYARSVIQNIRREANTQTSLPLYPVTSLLMPEGNVNERPELQTKLLVQFVRTGLVTGYTLSAPSAHL